MVRRPISRFIGWGCWYCATRSGAQYQQPKPINLDIGRLVILYLLYISSKLLMTYIKKLSFCDITSRFRKWKSWNIPLSSSLWTQMNILSYLKNSMKLFIWRCYLTSTSLWHVLWKAGRHCGEFMTSSGTYFRNFVMSSDTKCLSFGMANKQNFRAVRS